MGSDAGESLWNADERKLEYSQQPAGEQKDSDEKDSPHNKAKIWEIWDRESKSIYWFHHACSELLDHKADPLKLTGFFPSPPFLIANVTTMLYKPVPDYHLYQDLYNEIDTLESRINLITDSVRAIGLYDSQQAEIKRMFNEGTENTLIPCDNWALFAEKGGLRGSVDWYPIDMVASVLAQLRDMRNDKIGLLQRVTGMADLMSGQVNPYEGVAQSELKVAWGSVRVQSLQDQFAAFVSNLLQLQAEVICHHFEPPTLVEALLSRATCDAIGSIRPVYRHPLKADIFGRLWGGHLDCFLHRLHAPVSEALDQVPSISS